MFFDYDKKDLLRRIKTAKSVTSEIYIDEIFCSIQLYPHNSTCSIRFSCKCTDPNLTGIGGDEKYTLMFKTDVINRKIALGFITERVYYASLTFPNSVFYIMTLSKINLITLNFQIKTGKFIPVIPVKIIQKLIHLC
jgi:hypothetical protein